MTDDTRPAPEHDPRRVEGGAEPSTVDAPARWSGSAAVPPPAPKKSRWSRRRPEAEEEDERAAIPAVDPWAGHDTPVDPFPAVPEAPLPPTKIDAPAPTRVEPPAPAPPAPAPAPPAAPAPLPPAVKPAAPPPAMKPTGVGPPAYQRPAAPPPVPSGPPPYRKPPPLSRRERKAREKALRALPAANRVPVQTRPPLPPRPPWAAPPQPQRPLPPPRRKRRRGRLLLIAALGVLCCCGGPFAYLTFPAARQYPVSADLPTDFSDLSLRDDSASKRAADRLAEELRSADARDGSAFAGVYGDSRGKRVTVFGITGFRFTPKSDVRAQLDRLSDDFGLDGVRSFSLGETGAHESCGIGRADGTSVVVCAWADHGSMATVLLTRRSIDDSAQLVGRLRSAVLTPG